MPGRSMAVSKGLTVELSSEQVQAIVERVCRDTAAEGALDLALLAPSLQRVLEERGSSEVACTLVRGLLVLATFPADGTPRRLSEIAVELNMKKSTVHRCLSTLVVVGLLERDGETRRYFRLGRFSV
jgi:hypothetical protein